MRIVVYVYIDAQPVPKPFEEKHIEWTSELRTASISERQNEIRSHFRQSICDDLVLFRYKLVKYIECG